MTNSIDRDDLLRELHDLLPVPIRDEKQVDGAAVLVGGDPGEVIVRLSGNKVSIAAYLVRWEGPHTPVVRPKQVATLSWQRLPASATMMSSHGLIQAAVEIRRAQYRKCERCGETNRLRRDIPSPKSLRYRPVAMK